MELARASRFAGALPIPVGALAVAFAIRPIDDFDVWYHLAAGRLMAATWTWPATNTFAFSTPDHPWVDVHWLFQLPLYFAWLIGGPTGCIAFAAALAVTAVAVLYADARRFASPALVALLATLAITAAGTRFVPRPELATFLLLATFLWILDGYPAASSRRIYWLVPLQVIWINAHGTVQIGIPLIACYWAGATLAFLPLPSGWRTATGISVTEWRRLTLVLGLAAASTLLNPWGIHAALLAFDSLRNVTGSSILSARIGEFVPPFASGYPVVLLYIWVALLIATAGSFLVNVQRWHLGRLFAATMFALLSTQAVRNVSLFVLVAVPVVAANLGATLSARRKVKAQRSAARPGGLEHVCEALIGLVLILLITSVVSNRFAYWLFLENGFGVGVSNYRFSEDAVRFMREVGITGRPYNCFAMGGYLAWNVFPNERVFVDGRTHAYPESFYREYFAVDDDPKNWHALAARYDFDYAFMYHAWGNRLPLAGLLASGSGWQLVYFDEITSIYMPTDEEHRAVRERATRAFAEILAHRRSAAIPEADESGRLMRIPIEEIERKRSYANFLLTLGLFEDAGRALISGLVLAPNDPDLRTSMGVAYWYSGNQSSAIAEWEEVLRRTPGFARAAQNLASVRSAQ